jgi:hypothetical protein
VSEVNVDESLVRLQLWYSRQCDGDWEHDLGVRIESLDNPGWLVRIDLKGTHLDGRDFQPIELGLGRWSSTDRHPSSTDWHRIWLEDHKFQGAGDPSKLAFILKTFLDWAER